MCEVNNGFLFTKVVSSKTKQQGLDTDWTRRWFRLHNSGILKCYDNCYADQLVFEVDLQSEHVSHDDVIYPASEYGKPWILSVMRRERGEKLLLEADCEECIKKWTKFILTFLSTEVGNVNELKYESMKPISQEKPKVPPKPVRSPSKPSPGYNYFHSQTQKQDEKEGALIYEYIVDELTVLQSAEYENLVDCVKTSPIPLNRWEVRSKTLPRLPHERCLTNRISKYDNKPPGHKESNIYEEINYAEFLRDSSQSVSILKTETSFKMSSLNSLPDWKRLLSDFWPMCFVLPNGKVYTQLIDLTVCIQESLQSLLNCFQHSYPSHNSCLTLQVIGDLYQTYKPHKSSKKKGIQFVEWNNSFSNQGVVTSKVVKVSLREDTDVSLSSERMEEFVYGMSHLCESEMFCMSWVSFVKGNFPVMNMSVSALYSACIYLVYKRIPGNEDVDVKKFVPSHLQKLSHLNTVQIEIERISTSDAMSIFNLFYYNLINSPCLDAKSFPVVMMKKLSFKLKKIDCVLVVTKQHILIIADENRSSNSDVIFSFWKFTQVRGWLVKSDDNILFIQLSKDLKSPDNLIFQTPSAECINCLLRSLSPKKL